MSRTSCVFLGRSCLCFLIIFPLISPISTYASELLGEISTNPSDDYSVVEEVDLKTPVVKPAGNTIKSTTNIKIKTEKKETPVKNEKVKDETLKEEVGNKVLGIKIHPDGSLIRGSDFKIYLIVGMARRYIGTLQELAKYAGRKISSVSDDEIEVYDVRGHSDGELVRQRGDSKVYVLIDRMKKHILNLEELRARYSGKEIFNIFAEEMSAYKEWR